MSAPIFMKNIHILIFCAALLLILSALITGAARAKAIEEHIYLVPAGEVDDKVIEALKETLPDHLPMTSNVEVGRRQKIPQTAYDPSRNQYDAKAVLDDIFGRITIVAANERALIVTDVDLYQPESNFVFGLADDKKGAAIISATRLKNEFYGAKPDEKIFLERVLKEALREIGHSLGLARCPDPKCVMRFSVSLQDTDRSKDKFCHDCGKKLRNIYDRPFYRPPAQ